jgi:transcriptional regulator with XRE-family HTH domain
MEGELQRIVGRNLRAYRETKGLSQEAFADVVGVHRTYMGSVERGERNLTLKSVERLAARIEVEPMALLQTQDGVMPQQPLPSHAFEASSDGAATQDKSGRE